MSCKINFMSCKIMCVYVFLGYFLHKYNVLAKKGGSKGSRLFSPHEGIGMGGQTRVDITGDNQS